LTKPASQGDAAMNCKVLLADDHGIVREGLKALLRPQKWLEVVGEVGDGRELLTRTSAECPDVVVMDIAMPNLNGIEATAQLAVHCPQTRVIMLSVYSTAEHVYRSFRAGACGYLLKETAGKEILDAIRAVLSNRYYLSAKIRDAYPDILSGLTRFKSPLESLSGREKEILQLVVEGRTSAEIAARLALSPKTVETYRSRLMQKLGVASPP